MLTIYIILWQICFAIGSGISLAAFGFAAKDIIQNKTGSQDPFNWVMTLLLFCMATLFAGAYFTVKKVWGA
jgi:hypothetical protein